MKAVALDLAFARLADVSEQMRRKCVGRVPPRRHFFDLHVGQFRIEPSREHRRHLRQRGIVDDHDRPVGRLAAMAVDDFLHVLRIEACDFRQHANRAIEILRVLADDGDGERAAVFDEHRAVAIEHHAARRAQRDRALMVVLGKLPELLVLDDLEVPEAEGKNREHDGTAHLQHDEPNREAATIFNWRRESRHANP